MRKKIRYGVSAYILIVQMFLAAVLPCLAAQTDSMTFSEEEDRPIVTSVSISPGTVVVSKNAACAFTAVVTGENDYSRGVVWSVSGQTSQNTFIDGNGVLNVASDESASALIVKAVSRQDSNYSATALASIEPSTYYIQLQASPENGGSVFGSGEVREGGYVIISAVSNDGFLFEGWLLNGDKVSQDERYVADNITGDRTYTAVFKKREAESYTITASVSSAGGKITPEGKTTVSAGSGVYYTIAPESGYAIRTVYVDGIELGKTSSFNFTDVREDHTISADFVEAPIQNNDGGETQNQTEVKDDPEKKPENDAKIDKEKEETAGKESQERADGGKEDETKQDERKEDGIKQDGRKEDEAKQDETKKQTGTLAELGMSVAEAKRLIEENRDEELLAAARNTGALRVTVNNDFMDAGQENLGVPDFEKVAANLLSGEEKLKMLQDSLPVTMALFVKDTEGKETDEVKEAFEEKKLPGMRIGRYFELSIKKTKDTDTQIIRALPKKLKIEIRVPERLKAENRKFYILRLYTKEDGSREFAQLSDEDDSPDTITFSTDRLSACAIAYIDWEAEGAEALEQGESAAADRGAGNVAVVWAVAAAVGITSGLAGYIVAKRKKG